MIAYIAALLIGVTLGIFGGGGSILTVPVLIYLCNIPTVQATSYSLLIVGLASFINSIFNIFKGLINYKIVLLFGLPGLSAVFIARKYIIPSLPERISLFSSYSLDKNTAILLLFSVIMLFSSLSMIRGNQEKDNLNENSQINVFLIIIQSFIVGLITGIVGSGGGFLIIPGLIFFANLDIKSAITNSILIIAVNSTFGFLGNLNSDMSFDWLFIFKFLIFTISGMFIGKSLSNYISSEKLRPLFGYFVLTMGIFIIIKEIFLN